MQTSAKHIEAANQITVKALADCGICSVNLPVAIALATALNLPTLLAAQEALDAANNQIDALSNLLANIADTLRVRGFTGPKALDERVITMAQELDKLRAAQDELSKALQKIRADLAGNPDVTTLRKDRDCWLANAKELQKQVNGWEHVRAALLAVARTAKAFTNSDPRSLSETSAYSDMCNALSTLEPLGIKLLPRS